MDVVVGRKEAACFQEKLRHKGFVAADDSFHPDAGKDFFIAGFVTFLKHKSSSQETFWLILDLLSSFRVQDCRVHTKARNPMSGFNQK